MIQSANSKGTKQDAGRDRFEPVRERDTEAKAEAEAEAGGRKRCQQEGRLGMRV